MGKKRNDAPVFYAIAQAQFNPILNLDGFIPTIQARMREVRFPDYRQELVQRLVMPFGQPGQAPVPAPALQSQTRHVFGNIAGRTLFNLEANTLCLQTTEYDTFETFVATFREGLGILHEAIRLDFAERIGLRYLDAILPLKEGETLRDYLVPAVLGHALRDAGELVHSVSETVFVTPAGHLVSRVFVRKGGVGLPMELASHALTPDPRFTGREGLHAIIDTDAFWLQREAFSLERVVGHLEALHDEINKSFDATITEHAMKVWA